MSNPDDKVILAITNIKENTLASAPNNINNIVAQDTTSKNVSAAIQGGNNIIVTREDSAEIVLSPLLSTTLISTQQTDVKILLATPVGIEGRVGPTGPAGPGVSTGGTTGQILTKDSGTDYDTSWTTITIPEDIHIFLMMGA